MVRWLDVAKCGLQNAGRKQSQSSVVGNEQYLLAKEKPRTDCGVEERLCSWWKRRLNDNWFIDGH